MRSFTGNGEQIVLSKRDGSGVLQFLQNPRVPPPALLAGTPPPEARHGSRACFVISVRRATPFANSQWTRMLG